MHVVLRAVVVVVVVVVAVVFFDDPGSPNYQNMAYRLRVAPPELKEGMKAEYSRLRKDISNRRMGEGCGEGRCG